MCAKPKSRKLRVSAGDLGVEECEGGYCIVLSGQPLLTAAGQSVTHTRKAVLQHMIDEVDSVGKIQVLDGRHIQPSTMSALVIYGAQKDLVESHGECLSLSFDKCLCGDGVFYAAPGPNEQMARQSRWGAIDSWMQELKTKRPSLVQHYGDLDDVTSNDNRELYTLPQAFVKLIESTYRSLSPEHRAAVFALHSVHNVVLFPLLLALGKCSVNEYASGVMAVHGAVPEDWAHLSLPDAKQSQAFRKYRDAARVVSEWLDLFRPTTAEALLAEINHGESTQREFKSSLRWNVHSKLHDEVITHACLKTIAAFLNSKGGVLLVGVEDSGDICGIEHDGFPNEDRFQQHLYNHIQDHLGSQHATRVEANIISIDGKKVCRVQCQPVAHGWAYLKWKGQEQFFVRVGPSSKSLKPSEQERYMKDANKGNDPPG